MLGRRVIVMLKNCHFVYLATPWTRPLFMRKLRADYDNHIILAGAVSLKLTAILA